LLVSEVMLLGLLAILVSGVAVGRLTRHMTSAADLLLLFLVAAVVLAQYVTWAAPSHSGGGDLLLRWLLPGH
jgi:hypothetical protein